MKRLIKEYLFENWSLKATALLLSFILWLFVRGEPGTITEVSAPLEVQVPRFMEITNERPTSVYVTLATYRGAPQPHPTCVINLQGTEEGKHVITLTEDNVKLPGGAGVEIQQINPARVTLVLERTISKEVPITVPVRGEPADGFELYGRTSRPSSIIVTGPRSHIDAIGEVPTEAVSLNGLRELSRFFVSLNVEDGLVRTSMTNPVQVDIHIGPERKLSLIRNVPVVVDDPAYITTPKRVSVRVMAPVEWIPGISADDLSAIITTRNVDPDQLPARIKPQVRFNQNPQGHVIIKEVTPAEVLVDRRPER